MDGDRLAHTMTHSVHESTGCSVLTVCLQVCLHMVAPSLQKEPCAGPAPGNSQQPNIGNGIFSLNPPA